MPERLMRSCEENVVGIKKNEHSYNTKTKTVCICNFTQNGNGLNNLPAL